MDGANNFPKKRKIDEVTEDLTTELAQKKQKVSHAENEVKST